jgi:succinate dehydrogenase / fumarate reductase iron-sulfur subunit
LNERDWTVTFEILRQKAGHAPAFQSFTLQVDPDEYVLDGIERVWAIHDRSLHYRHACHHSTCGACGMRINGVEKLTCITTIRSITRDGGVLKVEPMRNFPVLSDLVVDMSSMYTRLEDAQFDQVTPTRYAGLPFERTQPKTEQQEYERLVDCIECGLCISACPISMTTSTYVGPAVLAALQDMHERTLNPDLLCMADGADGVWRCHSAYECSAVCPSNVDPAWRIMDLRRRVVGNRIQQFFRRTKPEETP